MTWVFGVAAWAIPNVKLIAANAIRTRVFIRGLQIRSDEASGLVQCNKPLCTNR